MTFDMCSAFLYCKNVPAASQQILQDLIFGDFKRNCVPPLEEGRVNVFSLAATAKTSPRLLQLF